MAFTGLPLLATLGRDRRILPVTWITTQACLMPAKQYPSLHLNTGLDLKQRRLLPKYFAILFQTCVSAKHTIRVGTQAVEAGDWENGSVAWCGKAAGRQESRHPQRSRCLPMHCQSEPRNNATQFTATMLCNADNNERHCVWKERQRCERRQVPP